MHEKQYWGILEKLFDLQSKLESEIEWQLLQVIEDILVLFKFTDSKEIVFENFKFEFWLPLYSLSKVFVDFALSIFKTKGIQSVQKYGLKNQVEKFSYFGLLTVMSIT